MVEYDFSPVVGALGAAASIGILMGAAKRISDMPYSSQQPRNVRRIQHKHKKQPYTVMRPRSHVMRHYTDNYWGV